MADTLLDDLQWCFENGMAGGRTRETIGRAIARIRELEASAAMGQVPEGWAWMRHPTRNGGEPIPVKIVNSPDDGSKWFIPFDEDACEFEWAERDEEWEILAVPPARDAERYRWLRRCKGQEHDPLFTVHHELDGTLWGGDLDAAIDTAMSREQSQGGE
ncbi:hypothetical protein HTY52_28920 [Cupriavidus taiwanensis]|nr:hypothetical protein [Cupriavidus taiwanensis]